MDERVKKRIKRIIALISLLVIIAVFAFITYFFIVEFKQMNSVQSFKQYIASFGIWGILVAMGLQVLEVFVALIPGEVV